MSLPTLTLPRPSDDRLLPNGLRLLVLPYGTLPIVKVDLMVRAGLLRPDHAGVARAAADLITAGSTQLDQLHIANLIDQRGAYVYGSVAFRHATLSLLTLQKHLKGLVPLFHQLVTQPTYPDEQVKLWARQQIEALQTNMLKSNYLAARKMLGLVYRPDDRFARRASIDDLNSISSQRLLEFHRQAFNASNALLIIAGRPSNDDVQRLADTFEQLPTATPWTPPQAHFNTPGLTLHIDRPDAPQAAICLCRHLLQHANANGNEQESLGEDHPDFIPFRFLDVAFGGYFGSRLMQRLRERMALTYGANSYVSSNRRFALHYIQASVTAGAQRQAFQAIDEEMRRLAEQPLTSDEVAAVQGAMIADGLRRFDTILSASATIASLLAEGYDLRRLQQYHEYIGRPDTGQLQRLAAELLRPERYARVDVG